jgi:IclR family transcriptional regulator, pca regulon regulatory protein
MTDTVRTDTQPAPQASDQYVQSLARGLAVIRAFDTDHPVMTLTEVAARTGLTRATARRFLHTLVELGYVRTDGKTFALTAKVLQLGYAYLSGLSLPQLAQPHLEELSLKLGESTSAAVLDGTDIAYIARVTTRRIMNVGITVGTRFPAYATSMGRVLLAGLPEPELDDYLARTDRSRLTPTTLVDEPALRDELGRVRDQGWAFVDEELEIGLRSLAAPVLDARGLVRASVNVSMSGAPTDLEPKRAPLLDAAARITDDLAAARLTL